MHLLVLSAVLLRAAGVPRVLGLLILAAGISYALDGTARLLFDELGVMGAVLTAAVSLTSIVGEVGLAIWLLVRGGRAPASS